jgi:hypothetical protein
MSKLGQVGPQRARLNLIIRRPTPKKLFGKHSTPPVFISPNPIAPGSFYLTISPYRQGRVDQREIQTLSGTTSPRQLSLPPLPKKPGRFSGPVLQARAENFVLRIIDNWSAAGRLNGEEVSGLKAELQTGLMREYLRGLGYHLFMKVFTDLLCFAAFGLMAAGQWWTGALLISSEVMTRTVYTAGRMWQNRKQNIPYGRALVFGLNPFIGGLLAYPFQMIGASPRISRLIISDSILEVARLGCRLTFIRDREKQLRIEEKFLRLADLLNSPLRELNPFKTSKKI